MFNEDVAVAFGDKKMSKHFKTVPFMKFLCNNSMKGRKRAIDISGRFFEGLKCC